MRLGLAIARPEVIAALDKIRDHYNLDRLAQAACVAALQDRAYFDQCVSKVCATREWFTTELANISYDVIPSWGNFVFAAPGPGREKGVRGPLCPEDTRVAFYRPTSQVRPANLHWDAVPKRQF
jgi:histidinol-phosphate aminotransferase